MQICNQVLINANVTHPAEGSEGGRRGTVLPEPKALAKFDISKYQINLESSLEDKLLQTISENEASSANGSATGISIVEIQKIKAFNQALDITIANEKIQRQTKTVSTKESSEAPYKIQPSAKPQQ